MALIVIETGVVTRLHLSANYLFLMGVANSTATHGELKVSIHLSRGNVFVIRDIEKEFVLREKDDLIA